MKYVLAITALILLFSCKQNSDSLKPAPVEVIKRPHGQSLPGSVPVTKTIGATGGTINTEDNAISVTIPAGAVSGETPFTIEEVNTTLEGATSRSFRLLPENVVFQKPVTIRFSYEAIDLRGTLASLLRLAYQDKDGYFYKAAHCTLDAAGKTLAVQTTHFSVWTVFEMYKLISPYSVEKGSEISPFVRQYGMRTPSDEFDNGLGELMDEVDREVINDIDWSLAGAGVLESEGSYATYFAPGEIPEMNPVTISVALTGDMLGIGQDQKVILFQPVAIVGSEYFFVTIDGVRYKATQPVYARSGSMLIITAMVANKYQFNIILNGSTPGVYACSNNVVPGKASVSLLNVDNPTEYYETSRNGCGPGDDNFYFSPGPVTLVSYPNRPGEFAEGTIKGGKLYTAGNYCLNPVTKNFSAEFRVL